MCINLSTDTHGAWHADEHRHRRCLMTQALKVSGHKTKKETVEEALQLMIKIARQKEALQSLRGIGWEGDLDEMRRGWGPPKDLLPE